MTDKRTQAARPSAIDTVKRIALATLLLLGAAFPAWAGFQEGEVAYVRGDHQTAVREWLPVATAGDARAEHVVALMYALGDGVPKDDVRAHMWIDLAVANYASPTSRNRAARLRQRIAARLSPQQLKRARAMAAAWRAKHTR